MNRGEQLLRGSGVAQQVEVIRKPYRYNGEPGWDPATLGPIPTGEQEREARVAEFARLRESGVGVRAAAAAVGLAEDTGRSYERQRRQREAGAT